VAERIRIHVDPACPWCYQTSRWVRRLEELGEVELDWGMFSLAIANAGEDGVERPARSEAGLRTMALAHEEAGSEAAGAFYSALAEARHERDENLDDEEVLRGALRTAQLDPGLLDRAMADEDTWTRVESEHRALVERTRSFGVPTIVLDGGEGPAIFGPVISRLPSDEDAVELFRHVAWLTRYGNFSELKRDRVEPPDFEAVRKRAARAQEPGRA